MVCPRSWTTKGIKADTYTIQLIDAKLFTYSGIVFRDTDVTANLCGVGYSFEAAPPSSAQRITHSYNNISN